MCVEHPQRNVLRKDEDSAIVREEGMRNCGAVLHTLRCECTMHGVVVVDSQERIFNVQLVERNGVG